ncbi:Uncharacterised protein [Pannonibacter phragmitetus]|uniref:Uncharacterized protein n=1 Tax=Pannonibacter phragmitetus TaxID=121719 RepID=A0A379HJJ9_9HYPH|nr:Uncharacterised protein [Pannonibacter phragmitetus]
MSRAQRRPASGVHESRQLRTSREEAFSCNAVQSPFMTFRLCRQAGNGRWTVTQGANA